MTGMSWLYLLIGILFLLFFLASVYVFFSLIFQGEKEKDLVKIAIGLIGFYILWIALTK